MHKPGSEGLNRLYRLLLTSIPVALGLALLLALFTQQRPGAASYPPVEEQTGGALPASVFGVEMNPLGTSGGLNLITSTATAWARGIVVDWSLVEQTETVRSWSLLDGAAQEYQNAVNAGLTPIIVVRGVPLWAQASGGSSCGPIADANFDDFAAFIADTITDPASPLSAHNPTYWAIWNEPDIAQGTSPGEVPPDNLWGGCWGDDTDPYFGGGKYGDMLKVVYPILKTANPQAQLIAGELLLDCDPRLGSGCLPAKFLEGILISGGQFDGLSFHAYDYYAGSLGGYNNPGWGTSESAGGPVLNAKTEFIRNLLDQYGYQDKFLMNTENALLCDACSDDPDFEATKAYYLVQAYTGAIAQDLAANIWYDVTGTWGRNNGLLKKDLTPLPAYDAYAFASQRLHGAALVSTISDYPGVGGYEFDNVTCNSGSGCHLWVIWAQDGSSHSLTLPATPRQVQSVFGQTLPANAVLNVGVSPIYIEMPANIPRRYFPWLKQGLLLRNGDFERRLDGWSVSDQDMPVQIISANPTSPVTLLPDPYIPAGNFSILLGAQDHFYENYECKTDGLPVGVYAGLSRTIQIPNEAGNLSLTFDYIIYTQDASPSGEFDRFEVYVKNDLRFFDGNMNSSGLSCSKWWRVPGLENPRGGKTNGWAQGTVDLSPYSGQTVTISFRNYFRYDGWYNTYTYIDNVKITSSN